MDYSRETICDLCRKSVQVSDVKYVPYIKGRESKMILCPACREKNAEKHNKTANISQLNRPLAVNQSDRSLAKALPVKNSQQRNMCICSRCNFKFKFDPDMASEPKCPYCGKDDRINKLVAADVIVKNANPDDE